VKKILVSIIAFFKKHPIIANILYIIIAGIIILWATMIWLGWWTGHGVYREVPDVKGLSYEQALDVLAEADLLAVLSDSIFNNETQPGLVMDQMPKSSSTVKPGRAVYLTINAYSPRTVTVPNLTDMSLRQAQSIIEGLGIKTIRVVEVPSEYKDLVLNVKYNGLPISGGTRIPISAALTIEVGEGYSDTDSIVGDIDNPDLVITDEY
jgi:beta-lactam-binding protein with PASTA domain